MAAQNKKQGRPPRSAKQTLVFIFSAAKQPGEGKFELLRLAFSRRARRLLEEKRVSVHSF